jgi:hypothetical protein
VLLDFPDRPMSGTWMIPLVVFGLPLANLAWRAAAWGLRALGSLPPADDLPGFLVKQGYSVAGAQTAWLVASGVLGVAAVADSLIDPFLANLGLVVLVAAGWLAARPKAVRGVGWLAGLIYAYAAGVLAAFVTSLHFHFLDPLFSETLSGYQGWDYFLLPRAFDCLSKGVSPYLPYPTEAQCGYGPWATPFVLHPLAALFPGALLHALPPWTSYGVFVAGSLAGLFCLFLLFASLARQPLTRSLIFLALFANWPLYLMLWLGQTHVFTVLAFGLVEYWLLRQVSQPAKRHDWLLVCGLLISLFSKPLILLFLPALLAARLTRGPAVLAGVIYAVVSAIFILVPQLNPGSPPLRDLLNGTVAPQALQETGNAYHWINILSVSGGLNTNHRDIYTLSTLLNVVLPDGVVVGVSRLLTVLTVGWATWLAWPRQPGPVAALWLALVGCLSIVLYYLAYTFAFEHQYPTLAIVPATLAVLWSRLRDQRVRRYVVVALLAFVPMLFPTIYRLLVAHPVRDIIYDFSAETLRQMTLFRSFRVVPALIMFIALFLALRRLRLSSADAQRASTLSGEAAAVG